jgi:hypothetical protein
LKGGFNMSCCRRLQELVRDLRRHFGETVTIFTTSGGLSGRGFTGVLISVNCDFVRLLSDIGPAPACALGSCCDRRRRRRRRSDDELGEVSENFSDEESFDEDERDGRFNRIDCRARNVGAIVDIPTDRIAAFVHNTLR